MRKLFQTIKGNQGNNFATSWKITLRSETAILLESGCITAFVSHRHQTQTTVNATQVLNSSFYYSLSLNSSFHYSRSQHAFSFSNVLALSAEARGNGFLRFSSLLSRLIRVPLLHTRFISFVFAHSLVLPLISQ